MPFIFSLSFIGVSFLCLVVINFISVFDQKRNDTNKRSFLDSKLGYIILAIPMFISLPAWLLLEYPRVYRHKRLLRMYDADIAKMRQVIRVSQMPKDQQPAAAEANEPDYVWVSIYDYEQYVLSHLTMDRNSNL